MQKIAVALCGLPTEEGNLCPNDDPRTKDNISSKESLIDKDDIKLQGYGVREEEICMTVFDKICRQGTKHNSPKILF